MNYKTTVIPEKKTRYSRLFLLDEARLRLWNGLGTHRTIAQRILIKERSRKWTRQNFFSNLPRKQIQICRSGISGMVGYDEIKQISYVILWIKR